MILTDAEIQERIESPLNLLNRLRTATSSSDKVRHPSIPPTSDNLIEDLEEKLQVGTIKSKATGIMIAAMDELKNRIPEVSKPKELAAIAAEMSKVINSTQVKREDDSVKMAQLIVYAPQIINEQAFEVIDMSTERY